ncbi:hypothetical protein EGW08_016962, partial [Elysia chlorotica]
MQEVASFDIEVEDCKYVDVIFTGSSWGDLQMQDCTMSNCKFYIQQKIKFGVRSDTGSPNNSPMVLYQAVNRIEPNKISQVPLTVMDIDGDNYVCKKATFKLMTFPHIRGLSVDDNCTLTVDSAAYPEGSWGMVNIVVQDKPNSDITMGGVNFFASTSNVLSQIQVQFLVQVAPSVEPDIVAPTACFTKSANMSAISVDAGGTLRIPVYAKPNPNTPAGTEIVDLKVICLPTPPTPLVVDTSSTKKYGTVWNSDLLWDKVGDAGDKTTKYLLQVVARDNQGYDSDACSFQVEVKENPDDCMCKNDGLCHRPHTAAAPALSSSATGLPEHMCYCPLGFSGPECTMVDGDPKPKVSTFDDIAGIPNGGLIQCEEHSQCMFAIHLIGRIAGYPALLSEAPKSPELNVSFRAAVSEESTALPGNRFVETVVITTGPPGLYKFCVNAMDSLWTSFMS